MRNTERRAVRALLIAIMSGCVTAAAADRSHGALDAPALRTGDQWTYRVVDGYRQKRTWDEKHEVTNASPETITIAVTVSSTSGFASREESWTTPGVVRIGTIAGFETKHFDPALIRFRFPLTSGEKWSQRVRDSGKAPGPYGDISFKANVVGHEIVSTPAGSFDAVKIRCVYQLDDESLSNYPTQCEYVVWYAPSVGSAVKEQRRSWSMTKGRSPVRTPAENATYELTAFKRAG
jgi:hypothetical protein